MGFWIVGPNRGHPVERVAERPQASCDALKLSHPGVSGAANWSMKFFFPDAHDLVDPSFNFVTERRTFAGSRQQSQLYAHEVLDEPPYDGMLLSKAMIDPHSSAKSVRYSFAQVQ